MRFEILNDTDVTVVRCSGRFVRGDGSKDLLRALMSQKGRNIQLDLSQVSAIDAGGVGVLVRLMTWAEGANRSLQLVNTSERVRAVLEITGLSSMLERRPPIPSLRLDMYPAHGINA